MRVGLIQALGRTSRHMDLMLKLLIVVAIFLAPSFLAAWLIPKSWPRLRYYLSVCLFVLLATPSWLVGEMTTFPVPFGLVLLVSVIDADINVLLRSLQSWVIWYVLAFPVTALMAVRLFRRVHPNNSFKPSPLRGSA